MKIGQVLGRAFRALKSGALWGFFATAVLAIAAPILVLAALAWQLITPELLDSWGNPDPSELGVIIAMIRLYAVLGLGLLVSLPMVIILQGGLIHLSDGVLAGRAVSVAEGWTFGAKRFFRTLGVEFLLYVAYTMAVLIAMIPFFLVLFGGVAASSGADDNPAGLIGGMCFGYLWLFVAVLVVVVVYMAVRGLALRYALVGDRNAIDACGSAFQAFRHAFKKVVLFSLAMLGLMYAYQAVTSIVLSPLMFFTLAPALSDPADPSGVFAAMWVIYPVSILLYLPMTLFNAVAWTAFFRELTGLDAPPVVPTYEPYAGPGMSPAPYPPVPQPPGAPRDAAPLPPAPNAPVPQPPVGGSVSDGSAEQPESPPNVTAGQ